MDDSLNVPGATLTQRGYDAQGGQEVPRQQLNCVVPPKHLVRLWPPMRDMTEVPHKEYEAMFNPEVAAARKAKKKKTTAATVLPASAPPTFARPNVPMEPEPSSPAALRDFGETSHEEFEALFNPAIAEAQRRGEESLVAGAVPEAAVEEDSGDAAAMQAFRDANMPDMIRQMMYVSGETGEPSVETTGMIEEIVRQQVVEMLRSCTEMAVRRGSRSITINDLFFQIRDDAPKVSRLRTFLSWKDVRKNVRDSDDKGGEVDLAAGEDPVGAPVPGAPVVDDTAKKNKKAKVGLPWEPSSFYSQEVTERDDEEDEEEEEMNHITLQRLRKADERTKAMTREEYVTWSEYRQASFTYRKGKRFREWAGFGIVTDSKPSDDIVDILGFLTFEMVQTLTEEALRIKEQEDTGKERTGAAEEGSNSSTAKKRKLAQGLFDPPSEGRTPVEPRHVQEAFRRLQARPRKMRAMLNHTRLPQRTPLKFI